MKARTKHRMGAVEGWVVTHDGETVKTGFKNDGEAMKWLHDNHSYSVDHAVKHEGYDIVLVQGGKVEWSYKRDILGKGRRLSGSRFWNSRSRIGGLRDMPLPPPIERPEMWTPEAIVQAVRDGFTFMIPFVRGESMGDPNAYWIAGVQASANLLTVGPEYTPEIAIIEPDLWIRAKTFFPPGIVPQNAWLEEPNPVTGVVPVYVEIDPDTIDWKGLNEGYQIRTRRD
jgi:hypothetical protein